MLIGLLHIAQVSLTKIYLFLNANKLVIYPT